MDSYSSFKGLHFSVLHHCSRIKKFFDSPGYDTPASQFFSILKYEYLGENETKFENILTHWSVAQASSNDEKNGGPKSRWTVPLTDAFVTSLTSVCLLEAYICGSLETHRQWLLSHKSRYSLDKG